MAIDVAVVLAAFAAFAGLALSWVVLPAGDPAGPAGQQQPATHRIERAPRAVAEPAAA